MRGMRLWPTPGVLSMALALLPLKACRCPRTDPLLLPRGHVLRRSYYPPEKVITLPNVHYFFHAWLDAWALTRFPPLHQDVTDVSELRKAVKQWICGNYNYLLNHGTIDAWLQEYPDIATTIFKSSRPKSATREEWRNFCNGYALTGFRPRGTQARMGDNFTCIALANL